MASVLHHLLSVWCALLLLVVVKPSDALSTLPPTKSYLRGRELATAASWRHDLLAAVNVERANAGLGALCMNDKLNTAAQKHTTDMTANNFLAHTGSSGSSLSSRATSEGFQFTGVAENVAAGQQSVSAVMATWMNSPGHRANILGNYKFFGAGLSQNTQATYGTYWTQVFGASESEACACIVK